MVADGSCRCGEHSIMHRDGASPESKITLCVNYTQKKNLNLSLFLQLWSFLRCFFDVIYKEMRLFMWIMTLKVLWYHKNQVPGISTQSVISLICPTPFLQGWSVKTASSVLSPHSDRVNIKWYCWINKWIDPQLFKVLYLFIFMPFLRVDYVF